MTHTWLVVAVVVAAVAEGTASADLPGYLPPGCSQLTQYVTKYRTQVLKVPVYTTTIEDKVILPTTAKTLVYKTTEVTEYKTIKVPSVTYSVALKTEVKNVKERTTISKTNYNTIFDTKTAYVPKYVTDTVKKTATKYELVYDTVYKTEHEPVYLTETKVVYRTIYKTRRVPLLHTEIKSVPIYKTLCPKSITSYSHRSGY